VVVEGGGFHAALGLVAILAAGADRGEGFGDRLSTRPNASRLSPDGFGVALERVRAWLSVREEEGFLGPDFLSSWY
jgi:hypothetical protein